MFTIYLHAIGSDLNNDNFNFTKIFMHDCKFLNAILTEIINVIFGIGRMMMVQRRAVLSTLVGASQLFAPFSGAIKVRRRVVGRRGAWDGSRKLVERDRRPFWSN